MAGRFPMPNTPRDIEEEERIRKIEEKRDRAIPPFKSFPIGEDPSEVLTDSYFPFPSAGPMPEDGMAKVKEALMQKRGLSSPGPASLPKGKPMSLKGDFEDAPRPDQKFPEFIGGDGGFSETPIGRTTDLPSENPSTETLVRPDEPNEVPLPNRNPEGAANPSGLAPGSGAEDKERRAREYLEQRMIRGEPTGIPFSDLLMRSAAQFGTLNGKHADTQPYSDFAKSLQGEENANEDRRLKIAEYLAKKNQARSSALKDDTFNREKLAADERRWNADREMNKQRFENESRKLDLYYQNMLNQAKNQGEVNEINKAYRQAMADIASQNASSLGSLRSAQVSKIEGEAPIRKKELELKEKELGIKEKDLNLKEKQGPKGKDFTKDQMSAATFARKMRSANDQLENLYQAHPGFDHTNIKDRALEMGGDLGQKYQDPRYKSFKQAELEFLSAILRRESMASITNTEYEQYGKIYFDRPGDGPEQKARKATARSEAIQDLIEESGGAFEQRNAARGAQPASSPASQPQSSGPYGPTVIQNGQTYRWNGKEYE